MNKRKAQPASRRPRRAKSGPVPTAPWPSAADSDKRRQALAAAVFRKYGITPEREPTSGIFASRVLDVLGRGSLAGFRAVRSPGRVIWCNFDLARQLGFDVPRTNQLTPPFHDRLLAALSFRSVGAKDHVDDRDIVTLYADRYGGDGVTPGLGAGRAGFLPYGNLYVKGVGFTPLFRRGDPDDFVHSHGGVHLEDCLSEAVFGEVNENLFTLGSTRVLAIVDQHKHVTDP